MITRRDFGKLGVAAAALISSAEMISQSQLLPGTAESDSPRRVGKRHHGTYWGHGFEKIDLLSGNLCFALPLLRPHSRGVSAVVVLSYNSQLSLGDTSGTKWIGIDSGFGFGWRLGIAAIVPQLKDGAISGYTYVDGHGSEYVLTQNGKIWVSLQSQYLTWDPALAVLRFASGKTYKFGCTSCRGEADAGSLYPTVIEDSNGNQILVQYEPGITCSTANSSSRLSSISDARSVFSSDKAQVYLFTYSKGRSPRLLSISANVPSLENYSFLYTEQSLSSPYADGGANRGGVQTLTSIVSASERTSTYSYNSFGEMTKSISGDGGILAWEYVTARFANGMQVREVSARNAQASADSAQQRHVFSRDTPQGNIHTNVSLTEHNQISKRVWNFNSDSSSTDCGLLSSITSYSGAKSLRQDAMSWSRTDLGAPYVGLHSKILDPGSSGHQVSRVSMSRDAYGNLLTYTLFDYGNPNTPEKVVRHTYLNSESYLERHILNRPRTKTIADRQGSIAIIESRYDTTQLIDCEGLSHHDSAKYPAIHTVRGNRTEQVVGGVSHAITYDLTGTVRSVQGGSGSDVLYTMAPGTNNTLVGSVAPNGNASLSNSITYSESGLPESFTGPNGSTVSYKRDQFGRVKSIAAATGAISNVEYSLNPTTTVSSFSDRWTKQTRDGFGRVVKTEHGDATGTLTVLDFEFSPVPHASIGKVTKVSLPHAQSDEPVWIQRDYDDLGRLQRHEGTTGSKTIEHSGNITVVKDVAGRWKKLVHNAQGKIVKVSLPAPDGGPDQETEYRYDTVGKLSAVIMPRTKGVQRRKFTYDAGGRPILRQHAESGTQRLTYGSDGLLALKVDAKGQRQVYTRDSLKRITDIKRYDAKGVLQPNETVSYFYDTNPFDSDFSLNAAGRLTATRWGSVDVLPGLLTEMYSYTPSGQVAAQRLRINRGRNDIDLQMICTYDDESRLSNLNYPAGGPSLRHTYDSLGKLVGLDTSDAQVVKDVSYDATGNLLGLKLLASRDGRYMDESRSYDSRSRLTELRTGSSEGDLNDRRIPRIDLRYQYRDTDGLLQAETDQEAGVTTKYDYDTQKRLASAQSSDLSWGLAFKYDGFNNRVSQSVVQGSAFENELQHDPATNWMLNDSTTYDANGNVISLPYLELEYDTLNRLKHLRSSTDLPENYAYDPRNLRIWVKTAKWGEQLYFYAGNKVLALYKLTTTGSGDLLATFMSANIYFGNRIVKSRGNAVVIDRLGATRAWSDKDGTKVTKYLPFGEELQKTSDDLPKFGGYQRSESNLDYAQNRYYASSLGRFLTPDPYEGSASASNPNSWNRYAFVKNDPMNRIDPNGLNDTILQQGHVYEVPNGNGATVEVTGEGAGTEYLPDGTSQSVSIADYNSATSVTELVTVVNADGSLDSFDVAVTGTPTMSEQDQAIYNLSVDINQDTAPWVTFGCNVGMGVGLAGAGLFFLPEAVSAAAVAGTLGYAAGSTVITMAVCP